VLYVHEWKSPDGIGLGSWLGVSFDADKDLEVVDRVVVVLGGRATVVVVVKDLVATNK